MVLNQNFDINEIKNNLIKIIKKIIERTKIFSNNFIYVIPYPPSEKLNEMLEKTFEQLNLQQTANEFYSKWVNEFKKMCKDLNISYISLEDFTERERGPENKNIPEPTKFGAKQIAHRLYNKINEKDTTNNKHVEYYKNILELCNNFKNNKKDKELLKIIILNNDQEFWKKLNSFVYYAIDNNINLEVNKKIKKIINIKLKI